MLGKQSHLRAYPQSGILSFSCQFAGDSLIQFTGRSNQDGEFVNSRSPLLSPGPCRAAILFFNAELRVSSSVLNRSKRAITTVRFAFVVFSVVREFSGTQCLLSHNWILRRANSFRLTSWPLICVTSSTPSGSRTKPWVVPRRIQETQKIQSAFGVHAEGCHGIYMEECLSAMGEGKGDGPRPDAFSHFLPSLRRPTHECRDRWRNFLSNTEAGGLCLLSKRALLGSAKGACSFCELPFRPPVACVQEKIPEV